MLNAIELIKCPQAFWPLAFQFASLLFYLMSFFTVVIFLPSKCPRAPVSENKGDFWQCNVSEKLPVVER